MNLITMALMEYGKACAKSFVNGTVKFSVLIRDQEVRDNLVAVYNELSKAGIISTIEQVGETEQLRLQMEADKYDLPDTEKEKFKKIIYALKQLR